MLILMHITIVRKKNPKILNIHVLASLKQENPKLYKK